MAHPTASPAAPLILGTDGLLELLDQSKALAHALKQADIFHRLIIIEKARHGFEFPLDPSNLLPAILDFLDSAWNLDEGSTFPMMLLTQ